MKPSILDSDLTRYAGKPRLDHARREAPNLTIQLDEWDDEEQLMLSEVVEKGQTFEQDIRFIKVPDGWHFEAECSCPIEVKCLHIVAAILAFSGDSKPAPVTSSAAEPSTPETAIVEKPAPTMQLKARPSEVEPDWVALWKQNLQQRKPDGGLDNQPRTAESIVYILHQQRDRNGRSLEFKCYSAKRMKAGGFGKPRPFDLSSIIARPNHMATPLDYRIARCALLLDKNMTIAGHQGRELIRLMLLSQRLHLENPLNPCLQQGGSIIGKLAWQTNPQGKVALVPEHKPASFVLPTEPPIYIDQQNLTCGEMISAPGSAEAEQLEGDLIALLTNLPPVPASHQPALEKMLQSQLAEKYSRLFSKQQASRKKIDRIQFQLFDGDDAAPNTFDLALIAELDGQQQDLLPAIQSWIENEEVNGQPLVLDMGQGNLAEIALDMVEPLAATLVELYSRNGDYSTTNRLSMDSRDAGRLADLQNLAQQNNLAIDLPENHSMFDLANKLKDFTKIQPTKKPKGLLADLRDYQQQGLNWLQFIRQNGFCAILADDMGLGKTLQTLSHLLIEHWAKRLKQPALIVAPASLLQNWKREAEKFSPDLSVLVWHGANREKQRQKLKSQQIIVTTYATLTRDIDSFSAEQFSWLILDEAQNIRNPDAQMTRAIKSLGIKNKLCLTGTPMENHLGELWSLFDFLMPGFLYSRTQFDQLYRQPIEKAADQVRFNALTKRIAPFMLRRTKQQVATELPPKTEILRSVPLEPEQQKLYSALRASTEKQVGELLQSLGLGRSKIQVLDALMKLRQVCCDPRLLKNAAVTTSQSAKMTMLLEMLDEMLAEGRKVLLFSQFTSMLDLIEQALEARKIRMCKLTGATRDRQGQVDKFQNGEAEVFLISLKAGGTGLNLIAADTVIHYDPWWNPAAEAQATDRAYRIGQDKPVFVYKLITEGTVEERIVALQQQKQQLAEGVLAGGELAAKGLAGSLDQQTIQDLLA
ncbi:DEAD/DEAH box helicase [Pelagibaculum spongiae]|uniref:Helicase n=1 Tax=Pelagibaculum spongiae TaxID=2080658 RepID=A0A2V1GYP6_9GAMM|nr:DEAD/DEAH box helicase [Pelagibaculum spongiae]PVZ70467.1 hypothetical protein DC094_07745 [Pelagibaculum spongiae]